MADLLADLLADPPGIGSEDMNTKHEDRSLDAVLFRFHREVSAPTPEIVAAWRREYPEHASEIEAHAMEVLDVESRAGAEA